jgi:hypothetical protein
MYLEGNIGAKQSGPLCTMRKNRSQDGFDCCIDVDARSGRAFEGIGLRGSPTEAYCSREVNPSHFSPPTGRHPHSSLHDVITMHYRRFSIFSGCVSHG